MIICVLGRVETMREKEKMPVTNIFYISQLFWKVVFLWVVKNRDCMEKNEGQILSVKLHFICHVKRPNSGQKCSFYNILNFNSLPYNPDF